MPGATVGRRTLGHCLKRLLLSQDGVPTELATQCRTELACELIVNYSRILQVTC